MLCYRTVGSGPPLLLVHGFGITYNIWKNLAPLLIPHFQLIMLELPGIDSSLLSTAKQPYYVTCASEIEHLRQSLGFEQWAILSYSTGTRAAAIYIHHYPHHVSQAVFLCPIILPGWRWYSLKLLAWLDNLCPTLGNWWLSGWRLYYLVCLLGFNGKRHAYVVDWISEISSQNIESLKVTLRDLPSPGSEMFELPIPSLFIWGKYDLVPSRPHHKGKNHVVIAANHSAPLLAAPDIASIAIDFFQQTPSLYPL